MRQAASPHGSAAGRHSPRRRNRRILRRQASDAAADGGRAHLRRVDARGQARPHRGAVREAAIEADGGEERRRALHRRDAVAVVRRGKTTGLGAMKVVNRHGDLWIR